MPVESVLQKTSSDCGLACLAMAFGLSLEMVQDAFVKLGKFGRHGNRRPWASTNKDLTDLAQQRGLTLSRFKFSGWAQVPPMALVKVNRQADRNFHWVLCEWSQLYGPTHLLIHDPAYGAYCPFVAATGMDEDISKLYIPFGVGLHVGSVPIGTAPLVSRLNLGH